MKKICFWLFLGLILPQLCFAKKFQNSYVSFDLPPNWDCKLEGVTWTCVNKFSKKPKEAIIILAAKEKGPADNIKAYANHLKTPRNYTNFKGKKIISKVKNLRERQISNQNWIDGLHVGSEVDNYLTRYLATVKQDLAILVTFSAHEKHYPKYANDFIKAIQSLRVTAAKSSLRSNEISSSQKSIFNQPLTNSLPDDIYTSEQFPEDESSSGLFGFLSGQGGRTAIGGFLILLALGGFYAYKKEWI